MTNVAELRPYQKKVDLDVKVVEKNEIREVKSKFDDKAHKVTEAVVGDSTGVVLLTLWDDSIDAVEIGKSYKVENGYTSLFKGSLRVNIGRYGTLKPADADVGDVNKDNNISEKEMK